MVLYGVSVPTVTLGDPTYLLWLMKPYPDINGPEKREINFKLQFQDGSGVCLWMAEGLLVMHAHLHANMDNSIHIIVACCVLHNVCETKGGYLRTELSQDRAGLQSLYRQPDPVYFRTGAGSQQTREILDVICAYILEQQGGRG